MTNKLVVIINSVKIPKIKELLIYEMKFLVPNYSCLHNHLLGGYRPPETQILRSNSTIAANIAHKSYYISASHRNIGFNANRAFSFLTHT